jgi:hypothetical protein
MVLGKVDVLARHLAGETEENHKNFSQDSRSWGQDFNRRSPECEAGMETTWWEHLIAGYVFVFIMLKSETAEVVTDTNIFLFFLH